MSKIVFKSSQDGINQLPEIMERLHMILHRSQSDYDVNISISISKIASKYNSRVLTDSSTSSLTSPPTETKLPKKTSRRNNNKTTTTTGTSSIFQQTSGEYVDLAKLRENDDKKRRFEKVSRSLISNRPHRK
uniref:Uncharacterized protein n=1 Tax=Strongyloides papillosus TaxID=174720 RepID=A0A0N5CFT4_STREA